jgi:hypothetical protein
MEITFNEYIEMVNKIKTIEKENPAWVKKRYIKTNTIKQKEKVICPCCNKYYTRFYMFYHKKTTRYLNWLKAGSV